MIETLRDRAVLAALGAAVLFGAGTPAAKALLGHADPWLLAGLLYAGSGLGLFAWRRLRHAPAVRIAPGERGWLAAAIFSGGVVGPALLMLGLSGMPASGASLLLNAEGVFTALLAWFVFRENVDRRIALGMALIVAGAAVLGWPGEARFGEALPALAVLGACFAWGLDNNFTRKVALNDATFIAMAKGLAAGATNIALALAMGASMPAAATMVAAGLVGLASYGVSLVLFVVALRGLGTARTGAYFSTAPFVGAVLAIMFLGESVSVRLLAGGGLMALGVWLHLTERHEHQHQHARQEHSHEHAHDEHHQHSHDKPVAPGERHTHSHVHEPMRHSHPHYPDSHHQHDHD
jgi:drug/metabolite transporter (DMT)-like permease